MKEFSDLLREEIQKSSEFFPFIAQMWEIEEVPSSIQVIYISYGHYETKAIHNTPFYREYSKIVDFHNINEAKNEE